MNPGSPSTPSSPYTLSNERYKANVNRTKTRKWVEAKKIDYGGDDWGAEDDVEEDDAGDMGSPEGRSQTFPQPQPSRTDRLAGLRATGDGSGPSSPRSGSGGSAQSLRPSERIAMERHGPGGVQQRNVTAPPALHLNTGAHAQRSVQPSAESQESSSAAQAESSPYPPRNNSKGQQYKPGLTQQDPPTENTSSARPRMQPPPAGGGSSPSTRVVRPSEIYKRMAEDRERERKSLDSTRRPSLDRSGSGNDPDTAEPQRRLSFGSNAGDGSRGSQPLSSVVEAQSEPSFTGLMINPGVPPPPQQPKTWSDTETETARDPGTRQDSPTSLSSGPVTPTVSYAPHSDDRAPVQPGPERYSLSPKLPDFTRLSGFGNDFLFGGGGLLGASGSHKQPEAPAEATRMPATRSMLGPGSTGVTAEPSTTRHARDERTAAQTEDETAALAHTYPPPEPSQPKPFRPSLPGTWMRETASSSGEMATPSSEQVDKAFNPSIASIGEHPDDASLKPAPLRTPTPRDRETFPKTSEDDGSSNKSGRSSHAKPQALRTTASPSSHVQQAGQTPTQTQFMHASSEAQHSSDVTPIAPAPLQPRKSGNGWATQDGPEPSSKTDTMLSDASSNLKESDVLRNEIIQSLVPGHGSASHLDAHGDAGAARESAYLNDVYGDYWSGDDKMTGNEQKDGHVEALGSVSEDGPTSATLTPPAASELVPVKANEGRERFSWEAGSSVSGSFPTKHPLPELPQDEPSLPPEEAPLASSVDAGRMSPPIALPSLGFDRDGENTTLKNEHAPSPTGDHEGAHAENAKPDSSTTPVPGSPCFTSVDPEPMCSSSPTEIPLPRSPSPGRAGVGGGGAEASLPMSSGQSTMSLKQILGLPTSAERVHKLGEVRAEFAAAPSGLPQWIAQLLAQPEHANAGPSFKYKPAGDDLPLFASQRRPHNAAGAAGAAGGGSEGLAAGLGRKGSLTLAGAGAGGGSVRIAAGAQAQLGHLIHGPAGAKGKELFQSAGKMGKGLLSKGKNKFRERAESKKN